MACKMNLTRLQEGIRTRLMGRTIFYSTEVGSTNEWAKELASQSAPEGTVAIAETQTHGHGRLDRKWISPAGGLWFSVVLRPKIALAEVSQLTFVAGLAVAETLRELYGLKVETKWPNDVLISGRKVCGILGEASSTSGKISFVVLGVGLNANFDTGRVFPRTMRRSATSLESELGRKVRLETLFNALLEKLEKTFDLYTREGFTPILSEWKKHALFLGRKVDVTDQGKKIKGTAYDVAKDGALVLRLDDGSLAHVFAGDVSLHISRRPVLGRDIKNEFG